MNSVYLCVNGNNPSLTVSHVVSLTVPTKTAPVGSNPFDDDEDEEEEMAEEQHTTVNHNSVKKEEIKMLVNRRKSFSFYPWIVVHSSSPAFTLFQFLCSFLSSSLLLQVTGCRVAMHGPWYSITHRASVCQSFILNRAVSDRTLHVLRVGRMLGNPKCFCPTVRSAYQCTKVYVCL